MRKVWVIWISTTIYLFHKSVKKISVSLRYYAVRLQLNAIENKPKSFWRALAVGEHINFDNRYFPFKRGVLK